MENKSKLKVEDKFRRIYKNQQKSEREELMKDYERFLAEPDHPWRISLYSHWSDDDLRYMIELLKESLR